jgi:NADH:ubiquinone oxidoreductase subunit F (NADH-binding)
MFALFTMQSDYCNIQKVFKKIKKIKNNSTSACVWCREGTPSIYKALNDLEM